MKYLAAFLTGTLFALGLGISGMMNPNKVMNFLDLLGTWDPSLAVVMMGALSVGLITFPLVLKKAKPICEHSFSLPSESLIDKKLIFGAALFGIGWAISGICPGPALANLLSLNSSILIFTLVMLLSMFLTSLVDNHFKNK